MTTTENSIDQRLQVLLDKQEINELLVTYMRAVDRGDVETLRSCYHDDATEDHGGVFTGTAADYVDQVAGAVTHRHALTSHVISNVLIDVDGDTATSECYATTFARIWTGERTADSIVGARMIDRFERRDGRWAIAHRQLVWEWNHDMATNEQWIHGMLAADTSVLAKGQKFPDDPIYGAAR